MSQAAPYDFVDVAVSIKDCLDSSERGCAPQPGWEKGMELQEGAIPTTMAPRMLLFLVAVTVVSLAAGRKDAIGEMPATRKLCASTAGNSRSHSLTRCTASGRFGNRTRPLCASMLMGERSDVSQRIGWVLDVFDALLRTPSLCGVRRRVACFPSAAAFMQYGKGADVPPDGARRSRQASDRSG